MHATHGAATDRCFNLSMLGAAAQLVFLNILQNGAVQWTHAITHIWQHTSKETEKEAKPSEKSQTSLEIQKVRPTSACNLSLRAGSVAITMLAAITQNGAELPSGRTSEVEQDLVAKHHYRRR